MLLDSIPPDFRHLFETSPDLSIVLSPDLTIAAVSEPYLRATMRERNIIGRNLFDVFPDNPDDPAAQDSHDIRASLEKVLKTGEPDEMPVIKYDVERSIADGGGYEERYWCLKSFPIFDDAKEVKYILHRVEDVTDKIRLEKQRSKEDLTNADLHNQFVQSEKERKQAEAALKDAQLRLEAALEAGEIGTWTFDILNDRVFADKSLAKFFSVSEEEATGGNLEAYTNAIHPEDRDRVQNLIGDALLNSDNYEAEYRIIQTDDNPIRWVVARGRVIRNEQGQAVQLPGVVIDITGRKKSEEIMRESRERFELVTRATYDVIWDWNLVTNEVWWNEGVMTMFGYTPEQVENTATWWYEHLHPEDRDRIVSGIHDVINNGGENWSDEYRFLRADGGFNYVFDRGYAVSRNGQPVRMLGAMQDITARKQSEEDLRESQSRLALALKAGRAGIFEWNIKHNINIWSPELEELYGVPTGTFEGNFQAWADRVVPEDVSAITEGIQQALKSRQTEYDYEFRAIMPDKTHCWLAGRSRFEYDSNNEPVRMIGINVDIDDRKQIEDDRQQLLEREKIARAEAENANRLKDDFLATLSHELRTPLSSILGWSRLLKERQVEGEQAVRAIETIERNAKSQSQLIEDILDVSRIISGKLRLDVRPVELSSIIETAIESVRPAAEAKNIRLQRVIDSGGMISGDADRLQQIIWNLLSNAVKFTPKEGRVQIKLERVNSHVEIIVADNGIGISAESLPFIFERFRQSDSSTTRKHGGLGLGLAIVRHLVELHGGTVQAASDGLNQGSAFTVMFPLIALRSKEVAFSGEAERTHPMIADNLVLNCPPEIKGLRILLVDDEPDTRDLITYVLESCKADVRSVSSVAEALEVIKNEKFEVLVSDIGMPERDGYDLIRNVRQLSPEHGGRIPAVALTAYARVEDRMRVLSAGFHMHVPKPVEPAELLAVIASLSGWNKQE